MSICRRQAPGTEVRERSKKTSRRCPGAAARGGHWLVPRPGLIATKSRHFQPTLSIVHIVPAAAPGASRAPARQQGPPDRFDASRRARRADGSRRRPHLDAVPCLPHQTASFDHSELRCRARKAERIKTALRLLLVSAIRKGHGGKTDISVVFSSWSAARSMGRHPGGLAYL